MIVSPEVLTTVGLAFLGGVVWAIRIEGRVNNHQTLFTEREKLVTAQSVELTSRLDRIEEKVDTLISRELGESRHGSRSNSGRL